MVTLILFILWNYCHILTKRLHLCVNMLVKHACKCPDWKYIVYIQSTNVEYVLCTSCDVIKCGHFLLRCVGWHDSDDSFICRVSGWLFDDSAPSTGCWNRFDVGLLVVAYLGCNIRCNCSPLDVFPVSRLHAETPTWCWSPVSRSHDLRSTGLLNFDAPDHIIHEHDQEQSTTKNENCMSYEYK